jgi:hypothetical protein
MLWMSPPRNDVSNRLIECSLSTHCEHQVAGELGLEKSLRPRDVHGGLGLPAISEDST